jgi:hypothetical protein
MTAGVYEFRDLMYINYPSKAIIGLKAYILLDHLLFSGLASVLKKQFALGHIVHGCDTHLL